MINWSINIQYLVNFCDNLHQQEMTYVPYQINFPNILVAKTYFEKKWITVYGIDQIIRGMKRTKQSIPPALCICVFV